MVGQKAVRRVVSEARRMAPMLCHGKMFGNTFICDRWRSRSYSDEFRVLGEKDEK